MVEVKRNKGESFDSLLRRFTKRIQSSGRILQAKRIRYKTKEKSKNLRKMSALRRLSIQEKREYLQRIGKLKEEVFGQRRGTGRR